MHSRKQRKVRIYQRLLALACLAATAAVAMAAVSPVAGGKRPAAPLDVIRITKLSDLAVAPDGRAALFMTDALSPGERKRDRRLWSVQLRAPWPVRPLTGAAGDRQAAWSPDGHLIAFLRARHGVSQVYVKPADGGPPRPLSAVPGGVDDFSWSPDSRSMLLTVPTQVETSRVKTLPDVRIVTRADYRDFLGYRNFDTRSRLWLLPISSTLEPAAPRALTDGDKSATFAFWSADSKAVYFTYADPRPTYYGGTEKVGLYAIAVAGGPTTLIRVFGTPRGGPVPSKFVPSPNHRYVAFVQPDPRFPEMVAQPNVMLMDLRSGKTADLTSGYDRPVGSGPYGFGTQLMWRSNDDLLALSLDHGNGILVDIDRRTGRVSPWWTGPRLVREVAGSAQSGKILAIATGFTDPPELYDISVRQHPVKLTEENRALRDELSVIPPRQISFEGPGGQTIHGYLQLPYDFDPGKRYPVVVWVHGGPYSWFNSGYEPDVQAIAGAGYIVLYMNPRGSLSYGQSFESALLDHWPGYDFADVMRGVHEIAKRSYVDATNIGIAGCSGGGIMVDWAITHTHLFKAAVSASDIADFGQDWFFSDQPDLAPTVGDLTPWATPEEMSQSAISYWRDIKTPTLFITASDDFRTPPPAGGEKMFRVLQYLKVPTALIRVQGAGHCLLKVADARDPSVLSDYLVKWMNRYLKGDDEPEFHVPGLTDQPMADPAEIAASVAKQRKAH
jgi:acylaminoacyl-peptidase